jgi:hypothetical protein
MTADVSAVGVDGGRPSPVKNWLTVKARPWLARTSGQVKSSTAVRSLPGVAAMIGWSVSLGGIAGHIWHGIGVWVGVGVLARFMTCLDSRIGG